MRLRTAIVLLACALLPCTGFAGASAWGEKKPDFKKKKAVSTETGAAEQAAGSPLLDNDILIGPRLGPQFTSYTSMTVDGKSTSPTNGTGYVAGGTVFWNVGWPRLEFDLFYETRKQGDRSAIPYFSLPILVKFAPIERSTFSWELGAGFQMDFAVGGAGTRRNVLVGMPVATDLLFDLGGKDAYLSFEFRYDFGFMTYDGGTSGGRPRDLSIILGVLFPIDRTD